MFLRQSISLLLIWSLISTGSCQSRGKREDITQMSPSDLNNLRNNVRRLQTSGEWVNLGGDHGIPNQYCPHGNLKFLMWHRRQIARIEELLGMPLPYWDWTKTNGVPEAYQSETYQDGRGRQRGNPLYSGRKSGGGSTVRQPIPDFNLDSLRNQEQLAMSASQIAEFSQYLEGAHNDIHGNIGGDMNSLDYAAFDPVFWIHHCNVDRIWYRWQRRNRFAIYPDEARGEMQDSMGVFMGEDAINDLSGWIPGGRQPNVTATQLPTMSSLGAISGSDQAPSPSNTSSPQFQPLAAHDEPESTTPIANQSPHFQVLADDDDDDAGEPHHPTNGTMNNGTMNGTMNNGTMNGTMRSGNKSMEGATSYQRVLKSVQHQLHSLQSPLQIETNIDDDPLLRTSVEQPGYEARNRSVLMMKGMESSSDPLRIDIYLSGELIGWIHTFGMGKSTMKHKLNRFFDITKHADKCSHDQIQDQIQFRVTNQKTGQVEMDKKYELQLVNMLF